MQVLLIRHAPAVDRDEFAATGEDDSLRPLTDLGRRKMQRIARSLRQLVPHLDLLAASPLARARETADVLDREYGGLERIEIAELTPDAPTSALLRWLRERRETSIALVGHEPDLSRHASWLLAAKRKPFLTFRKGGACLLELEGNPRPGGARLVWAIPPRVLREGGGPK